MSEWLSFIQATEVRANVDAICGRSDFKEEFGMMTKQAELKKQAYASKLKSRALSVLIYLIDRSNKELTCFPAIPTMAEQLHISVSTVKRALHELLDSGYIKKDFRFREKNKGQTSNLYTLVLFEGGSTPDGDDGLHSKESGAAEVKQEKEEEAGQGTCQVEHISFDTLARQKEEVEEPKKAEQKKADEKFLTDVIKAEKYPKIKRKSEICDACTRIQTIIQFFIVRNGDRNFSFVQQDNERTIQEMVISVSYKLLLYLWTGEGFSLMPP